MQHYCLDRLGVLGKLQQTPQGGYRCDAAIARVGILEYLRDGKVTRVYNPPHVLEAALDSLRDAPVTREHPTRFVTPETYGAVARGTVSGGSVRFQDGMVYGQLALQDATLLADIEAGSRREVSAGYLATEDGEPGITPDGQAYDSARTAIVYNHVAVVTKGRAGAKVCLALDSADIPQEDSMVYVIDGAEVSAENLQASLDALVAARDAARADADSHKERADSAVAEVTRLSSSEHLDSLVRAEMDRRAAEVAAAGRRALVAQRYPKLALDGKSDAYVEALYDAIATEDAADDGVKALKGEVAPPVVTAPTADAGTIDAPKPSRPDPRQRMVERNRKLASERLPGNGE